MTAFHVLQDPVSDELVTPAWWKGNLTGNASIAVALGVAQPFRRNVHNNSDPGMEASMHVYQGSTVRRLTPTECERLQALPDGWTQLGGTPDSRRYAGLGDAVTASVAEWIGERLIEATA